ncbi:hypothetical protein D9758_018571 [Tetrapyrgos nigripes]|uniref:Uncharacterized protein n=1 Tax=Tetrapyrgos nigripes TaxID=182062 RepID=A0A8H5B1H8_9AGAR|nr:hypothetical protein D9758_018571 [Tetrapyrgos nigripes]
MGLDIPEDHEAQKVPIYFAVYELLTPEAWGPPDVNPIQMANLPALLHRHPRPLLALIPGSFIVHFEPAKTCIWTNYKTGITVNTSHFNGFTSSNLSFLVSDTLLHSFMGRSL